MYSRHSPRSRPVPIMAAGLACALVLGGCSSADPDVKRNGVAAAKTAAAQYDYTSALEQLDGLKGDQVEELADEITAQQGQTVEWKDNSKIPHLFFHSLIVDPERAFDKGPSAKGYADYMATVKEFKAILPALYAKGYVLVNPHDIAGRNAQGEMEYRPVRLPEGKKPIILSEDDVNYYEYMEKDGFAANLVVGDDGNVTNTYRSPDGQNVRGAYDVPTIVDDFVEKHPDFSYQGSKGVLAVTGYNGALGYRTSEIAYGDDPAIDIDQQKMQAARVATALKDDGWVFASHSWNHINMTDATTAELAADTKKWNQEVRPIVGDTDLMILPFGADLAGVEKYSGPKYELLERDGYDFYYGVDATVPTWTQNTDDYFRQSRINVDGMTLGEALKDEDHALGRFFDVEKVIDPARKKYKE